jgi:hypothetical protein
MSAATAAPERLLPLRDGAARIGLTVGQLRRAIERGDLTPVRLGSLLFVTDSALAEMIEKCRARPKARDSISTPASGSSAMVPSRDEQALALTRLQLLSRN